MLLYGCEVWGYDKNDIIEQVHLKFLKYLLHMKKSTPNFMVYGESGRYPLDINIKTRIISYWCKLLKGGDDKLASCLYRFSYFHFAVNNFETSWIKCVKQTLDMCGYSNIFYLQNGEYCKWLKSSIRLRLMDQFQQSWYSDVQNMPKGLTYRLFKDKLDFENYFDILDDKDYLTFCRFRTLNHALPIERGRWLNIERGERKCISCNQLGDEFHYIMECSELANERKEFLPSYFTKRPNIAKFNSLFTSSKISVLKKLCKFIRCVNKKVSPPG